MFLAVERESGERVAIKVLRPELAEALSASRFVREVEIARTVRHPGILSLRDSGTAAGLPYFVMPFVEGGTLRARLRRERQLPIPEVLRIARAVADALDHAHDRGLVHRDIKPANILLGSDRVAVADFGIARAVSLSSPDGVPFTTIGTPSGLALGTPEYMSPEQATADRSVDRRTDVYALGCVVYEMLAGEPPFTGSTTTAIVARHCQERPRSVRIVRPTVPEAMERAVEQALAKVPADRFATAGELATALERAWAERATPHATPWWLPTTTRSRAIAAAVVLVLVVAGGLAAPRALSAWRRHATAAELATLAARADTTTYAVLVDRSDPALAALAEPTRAALRRWDGIRVVDSAAVRAAVASARASGVPAEPNGPALLARAGRYVRLDGVRLGDSLRVYAVLLDARHDSALARATFTLPLGAADVPRRLAAIVDGLLFPDDGAAASDGTIGTTSFTARRSYGRALVALGRWELAGADSGFATAARFDSGYAQAQLRLALVRQWDGAPVAQWGFAAERAIAGASRLSANERTMAAAVLDMAHGRRMDACARWQELTRREPSAFTSWYGLGDCLAYDSVVVRDDRVPGGWRFRTSSHAATQAFARALELVPQVSGDWIRHAGILLHVSTNWVRVGRGAGGDTIRFMASASWDGDTLEVRPVPAASFRAGGAGLPARTDQAVLQARVRFQSVARGWRSRDPADFEPLEAVAIALDLLANPDAFDTLRLARARATAEWDRLRIGSLEVWLRAKYALPDRLDGLARARQLADSLLGARVSPSAREAELLGGLAALTGRASLAARSARPAMASDLAVPLEATAPYLVAWAAMGGPPDTLRTLALATERAIGSGVLPGDRDQLRLEWMTRAALLAVPDSTVAALLAPNDRAPADLLAAWRGHDLERARRILALREADPRRAALHAWGVTIDAVYGEAAVLASLGDRAGAAAWLDPMLDSLSLVSPMRLSDAVHAGTLVRAMILRADLAAALGDTTTARRWARASVVLLSNADPFLLPVVDRMRRLSR